VGTLISVGYAAFVYWSVFYAWLMFCTVSRGRSDTIRHWRFNLSKENNTESYYR